MKLIRLARKSLFTKIAIFYFILGFLPLMILMFWAFTTSNKSLTSHLENNVLELIKQKAAYTGLKLYTVENLMHNISNVEEVVNSLKNEPDNLSIIQKITVEEKIGHILGSFVSIEGIESIDIISRNMNRYQNKNTTIHTDIVNQASIENLLNENNENEYKIFWHGVKPNLDNKSQYSLVASKKLMYYDKEKQAKEYLGLLIVHFSLDELTFEADNTLINENFRHFIVDNNGKIVYSDISKDIGSGFKTINDIEKNRIHNFDKMDIKGGKQLILKHNLSKYNLKFFTFIDNKYLWYSKFNLVKVSLFGIISILLFSAFMFYIFSKKILFPIREIKDYFVDITNNKSDYKRHIRVTSHDEIGELQRWFNSFLTNLGEKEIYAKELKVQKELAEIANKSKDNFLASISHELRTPLNGVISVSQLLNETDLSKQQEEYVDIVQQSSTILYSLINQVLDFSKITANRLDLSVKTFNIKDLLVKLTNLVQLECKTKNLQFIINDSVQDKLYVEADELAIQKVLLNLLNNSVKYTNKGFVKFDINIIEKSTDYVSLSFSVSDSGIGIPKDKQESIFEAFEQVDNSLSKKVSGSGLGLSIAQQLTKLMGSEIELVSPNPNLTNMPDMIGSVFQFKLKLKLARQVTEKVTSKKSDILKTYTASQQLSCLIVEDNVINQKIITSILHRYNIKTQIANNWTECLSILIGHHFDYIFMDIQMPEVTGIELTKMVREKDIDCPIIAVSGNVIDSVQDAAFSSGMNGFIGKPIKISEIEDMLVKFLPPSN